jgi:hypothetical protein
MSDEIADVAADICNPVVKLRFLRDVIDNQHRLPVRTKYMFFRPTLRALLQFRAWVARVATSTRASLRTYSQRLALLALSGMAITVGARSVGPEAPPASAPIVIAVPAKESATKSAIAEAPLQIAESLPIDTLGITPTTIWLADRGPNWELYSNGLRIETTYAVAGDTRRFRIHDREAGLRDLVYDKPMGIVFHTSESDIWDLDSGYAKQLRQSSAALLRYVQEKRAYNYVIDRFGRVYRIVDDETKANHAGHSIWASGRDVYLDLNNAFLGVSFESRFEGGRTLPITRAQLIAGRNLTHYLRQRFAIAPELCVTHGMTSVSPKQHLIGYHIDWARGFPFAAFGLPDQYAVPPPSIALFGFGYSDELIRTVGDGWPGALQADTALAAQAVQLGLTVEQLRAKRRAIYTQWSTDARRAASASEPVSNSSQAESAAVAMSLTHEQRG